MYLLTRTVRYLEAKGVRDRFTLIAAGGLKGPADFAKVLALGADAIYTAGFAKFALGCVYCRSCESGSCPTGITTQDPTLRRRLTVDTRAREVENLLRVSTNEIAKMCRLCGVNSISALDRDLVRALTIEISTAADVPLASRAE